METPTRAEAIKKLAGKPVACGWEDFVSRSAADIPDDLRLLSKTSFYGGVTHAMRLLHYVMQIHGDKCPDTDAYMDAVMDEIESEMGEVFVLLTQTGGRA